MEKIPDKNNNNNDTIDPNDLKVIEMYGYYIYKHQCFYIYKLILIN